MDWTKGAREGDPQATRLLPGGCVLEQGTNLGRAGGRNLRSTPTSAGCRRGNSRRRRISGSRSVAPPGTTDQVDRFAAVAIDDIRVGAFLKQVANQIGPARLRRNVQSCHAFVRG